MHGLYKNILFFDDTFTSFENNRKVYVSMHSTDSILNFCGVL